jgi:hypothetical protein
MSGEPKPLEPRLLEWLQKSGYPLELFAHDLLLKQGYVCEKSALYTDIESHAEREIDVVAEKSFSQNRRCSLGIHLLVECKKSENPVVVLASDSSKKPARSAMCEARVWPSELDNDYVLASIAQERNVFSSDEALPFSTHIVAGYSVVQAFKNTDELFHKTLYGLAKAEDYFERRHNQLLKKSSFQNGFDLYALFPICLLALDAPFFEAFLDDGQLAVREVGWSSVTLNLPWVQRPQSDKRCNIQIVQKTHLSLFLEELDRFAAWLADSSALPDCRARFISLAQQSVSTDSGQ